MKIIIANIAILICFVLSRGTSVDSVTVDSVWNSDLSWYDGNGVLQQRLSRDCIISFIPQDSGYAACSLKVSLDSGKTWNPDPNPLSILSSDLVPPIQCGKKARVIVRIFGSDRSNVVFKITANICYTYSGSYESDTLAARAILDANNITTISPSDAVCFRKDQRPPATGPFRIVDIRLANKGITVIPAAIGQLTALENVWLDSNSIIAIPTQIGKCKNLVFLDLSYNKIMALPQEINGLTALKYCRLSHNNLTSLPAGFYSMTALTTILIDNNALPGIDSLISNLTNLQRFDISHNQMASLPQSIIQLSNIQAIVVDANKLCALPQAVSDFISLRYGDTTWKTTQICP
jgi:hypothetical protein